MTVAAGDPRPSGDGPLAGRTVVVTRPRAQAGPLVDALRAAGARPVLVPAIEIGDPADGGAALRAAVARLDRYDWVVCTSANGAARLLDAVSAPDDLRDVNVAAVGPASAAVFEAGGVAVDLVPARHVAEALLDSFADPPDGGGRVLIARAAVARDVLPDGMRAAGWEVDVVEAYRTGPARVTAEVMAAAAGADAITFTSASTVTRYLEAHGAAAVPPVVACIGPITGAAARDAGLAVAVEAHDHTAAGLVAALCAHFDP